jgi:hypothetical protein
MYNHLETALKFDEKAKFDSIESSLKSDSSLRSNNDALQSKSDEEMSQDVYEESELPKFEDENQE